MVSRTPTMREAAAAKWAAAEQVAFGLAIGLVVEPIARA
jgi:hypothetical protein